MSSSIGYSYCAAHDDYFVNDKEREHHIQRSKDHPQCHICDRRFLNLHTLRKHFVIAVGHHYCEECRRHFKTTEGLEYHLDCVHRSGDDSDDEDDDYPPNYQSVEDDDWEDERGLECYPDGVPAERLAHKRYADDDNSWEAWDGFDFEDEEDLADPVTQDNEESDEEEEDEENLTHQFVCPMCEEGECAAICATRCGHLFCAPCITAAFKHTHECPICDETGEVSDLRRIYVAASDE
ncbi:hypothetical protein GYMLUDRAFT_171180 [Collybiopsis luxurians FD-317 M1]|uniref:Unplaced genomic scaffold GYMLUscaffold_38, whole genome shotgun sequence n=1 Tax=Collybiopsis luxurians FD-317 M1 TaxID=944289 RepID=A0A0D0C6Z4_9AGAR|nr:hypothetical protein GYMLUDRAFT_171180 [Collybiopsis luxurians FD-317 M1]